MPSYFGARRALFAAPYSGPLAFNVAQSTPNNQYSVLTFSNDNKTVADTGLNGWAHSVKTYYPKSSGAWFVEFLINSISTSTYIGLAQNSFQCIDSNRVGLNPVSTSYYSDGSSGIWYYNGTNMAAPSLYTTGDRIQMAYDLTGATVNVRWYRNGTNVLSSGAFLWAVGEACVPVWSNERTGSSATVQTTPYYNISGYTYLSP